MPSLLLRNICFSFAVFKYIVSMHACIGEHTVVLIKLIVLTYRVKNFSH